MACKDFNGSERKGSGVSYHRNIQTVLINEFHFSDVYQSINYIGLHVNFSSSPM